MVQSILEYAAKQNLSPEKLCSEVPYTLEYLRNKRERIEWDVFCRIMANLRLNWSDDEFERMGFDIIRSVPFRSLLVVVRLLFTGPELYFWWTTGPDGPGRQLFSCLTPAIEQIGKNHIVLTLTLQPGYDFCREVFVTTKGSMAAGPELIGLGPARVSMREIERGAIYDILCPEGGGAISRLRRAIMRPFAARTAARELKEANEALHERYAQLEDAREKVQRQATQLKVAYDISRLIHANLDLDSTLAAIARSLVTVAGFAAAILSVDTLTKEEPIKRIAKAGVEPPGSPRVTRALEGHGERIGEITLWLRSGSDLRESDELLDYVIPTIAMEIDDALSFKLVTDYRNSLQHKVDERTQELKETNESLKKAQAGRDRLFSNISHEFRTPLTLILGPADDLLTSTDEPSRQQKLQIIKDSARRLLGLVNQLLDFSRLGSGMMRLQATRDDIVTILRRAVMSFESWAERKHIRLELRSDEESIQGFFDADKLEKIINNLMSNALKFTAEGGRVSVHVGLTPPPVPESEPGKGPSDQLQRAEDVSVSVADTGFGISVQHLSRIFDRFYRVDETHTTEGAGIGLALTKELVDLHHGTIAVESTPGKGSVFTVVLPVEKGAYSADEISETPSQPEERARFEAPAVESRSEPSMPPADGKPIVLVVEDNADLRDYIREFLEADYAVHEAGNGKEGLDRALELVPDLVISDVMMPEMNGMELCLALKQDVRTSHVPVILLTARAGMDSKIEGLETGADDYVTKPFDSKELLARVRNLIEQRRQLRAKFSAGLVLKPGEVAVSSLDDTLLKKVMTAIENRMSHENLCAEDIAHEVALSRRHLDRKLMSLTNLSGAELIRYMRLQRARELLDKNAGTVAEIAFQVGFGSPSHFTSCFRERFGCLPSEVHHRNV